jgi:hypothetical protein
MRHQIPRLAVAFRRARFSIWLFPGKDQPPCAGFRCGASACATSEYYDFFFCVYVECGWLTKPWSVLASLDGWSVYKQAEYYFFDVPGRHQLGQAAHMSVHQQEPTPFTCAAARTGSCDDEKHAVK